MIIGGEGGVSLASVICAPYLFVVYHVFLFLRALRSFTELPLTISAALGGRNYFRGDTLIQRKLKLI